MDLGTLIGFIGGFGLIVVAMILAGSLGLFWDLLSILIVFGGAFFSVMVRFPLDTFIGSLSAAMKILSQPSTKPSDIIPMVVDCANTARKGSILALEKVQIDHEFFAKAVRLLVDGFEPEVINGMIDLEIDNLMERHKTSRTIIENFGEAAPAFGMIGTVIGLIVIMANLSDPNAIGPGLAVALITTLYGALIANMIFIPIAGKLKFRSDEEVVIMEIVREGINSISKGENPRAIQQKLESFVAPKHRSSTD